METGSAGRRTAGKVRTVNGALVRPIDIHLHVVKLGTARDSNGTRNGSVVGNLRNAGKGNRGCRVGYVYSNRVRANDKIAGKVVRVRGAPRLEILRRKVIKVPLDGVRTRCRRRHGTGSAARIGTSIARRDGRDIGAGYSGRRRRKADMVLIANTHRPNNNRLKRSIKVIRTGSHRRVCIGSIHNGKARIPRRLQLHLHGRSRVSIRIIVPLTRVTGHAGREMGNRRFPRGKRIPRGSNRYSWCGPRVANTNNRTPVTSTIRLKLHINRYRVIGRQMESLEGRRIRRVAQDIPHLRPVRGVRTVNIRNITI